MDKREKNPAGERGFQEGDQRLGRRGWGPPVSTRDPGKRSSIFLIFRAGPGPLAQCRAAGTWRRVSFWGRVGTASIKKKRKKMGILEDFISKLRTDPNAKSVEPGLVSSLKYLAGEVEKIANRVAALEKEGPDDHD